jgi:2-polyprenyl-6-methoxyphenol hydroxylase-like FAD-dependent oxidoreductase
MVSDMEEVPVLIVGGGPVGLSLTIDLGWRGVDCLLVEQSDGTIFHPRANAINSRTMEFCRRWGIADAVRDAGAPPEFPATILYITGLQGYELARIERPTHGGRGPLPATPERPQRCNQLWFDPVLRDRAGQFDSVTLAYETRFESFERTEDGVVAALTDLKSGAVRHVRARYLVSCCGGRSAVPKALGVHWEGRPVLSYNLNIFIRVDKLWRWTDKGQAAFYMLAYADGSQGALIELDGNSLWRLGVRNVDHEITADNIDVDAVVRRAIGPDVPYEVVSALPWTCRSVVADRWADGPVLLAGDAVHQHSPAGGFGMNTGMGDAVDLGWKLAALVDGWGGDRLLQSYPVERRPVAQRNVRVATEANEEVYNPELVPFIEDATSEGEAARKALGAEILERRSRQFISDGIALGYCYEGSPVVWADGSPPPPDDSMRYTPTTRPGARAPHGWIGKGRSTLDLFGRGFVLLAFNGAAGESAGLGAAAQARGVPFETVAIDDPGLAALYERRLVLVRPDGHVAWRGDAAPDDPGAVIEVARGAAG